MRTVLKLAAALVVVVVLVIAGGYFWLSSGTARILAQTYEAHTVDFPIPFPLSDEEIVEMGLDSAGPDELERIALERAIERGRHLVSARYACADCHGENFGGGVMIDAFPIGRLLGPNLTTGEGSRTLAYTAADWDRTVRHGILPDGRGAVMPSEDFRLMSDQELSDIVAYIQSLPPVDNAVPAPTFGPVGKMLTVTGQFQFSANLIEDHQRPHRVTPPEAAPTAEFGEHIAATCVGCHGGNYAGGPIVGGDPSWPPSKNLTPHPDALGSWSYEDFVRAVQQGVRPDGTEIVAPMTIVMPYAQRMNDTELQALWAFLQTLPPITPISPAE